MGGQTREGHDGGEESMETPEKHSANDEADCNLAMNHRAMQTQRCDVAPSKVALRKAPSSRSISRCCYC